MHKSSRVIKLRGTGTPFAEGFGLDFPGTEALGQGHSDLETVGDTP